MATDGYIKIWRRLFNHPIWLNSTPEQKCILIALIQLANHKDNTWEWKGKEYVVKRGQMITSTASIMRACGDGISEQNVKTALARFKKLNFLTYESTKSGRLITIENYSKWQGDDAKPNQEPNRQLTNGSPRPNQRLTTNKNVKNDKNDKNIYNARARACEPDLSEFSPELQETINDWLTYKEERKESYKPKGLQAWLGQVRNHSKSYEDKHIIAVIEKTMSCQYKGVVWDWLNDKPRRPRNVAPEPEPEKDLLSPEEHAENLRRMREKFGGMFGEAR